MSLDATTAVVGPTANDATVNGTADNISPTEFVELAAGPASSMASVFTSGLTPGANVVDQPLTLGMVGTLLPQEKYFWQVIRFASDGITVLERGTPKFFITLPFGTVPSPVAFVYCGVRYPIGTPSIFVGEPGWADTQKGYYRPAALVNPQ